MNAVIAIGFLAIVGIMVSALFWRATLEVAPSFNEGWNAYHASSVFKGLPLYPPHESLIGNNYPPLSFLVTGLVMHVVPDAVFAGRLISSLAFLTVAVLIGLICHRRDGDTLAAVFAGAVFAGCMASVYPAAVGLYDPQMLAYAFLLAGVLLLARDEPAVMAICTAALLITCALFVKHNIVSIVVALALWLFLYSRKRAFWFAGAGTMFGLTAFALCYAFFGKNFFTGMLAARTYMPGKAWHDLMTLPATVKMLVVLASPVMLAWRNDRWAALAGLCLISALLFGTVEAFGDGVGDNAYFEVVIASALGIGHLLTRTGGNVERHWRGWLMTVTALACLWDKGLSLAKDAVLVAPWRTVQRQSAADVKAVVARVAAVPGPALCQTTLYCYWAGKTFEFDNFRFMEGLQSGGETDEELVRRVGSGYYGSIVVNAPESDFALTRPVLDAIHKYYKLDFVNIRQIVYIRRAA